LQQVTGPRGRVGLRGREARVQSQEGLLGVIAEQLSTRQVEPMQGFLRAIAAHVGARGIRWSDNTGQDLGISGIVAVDQDRPVTVSLADQGILEILAPAKSPEEHLDLIALQPLAVIARTLSGSTRRQMHLLQAVDDAQARTREVEEAMETARRGPVAALVGGHFPSVAGRCPALRRALDRLSMLSESALPVLLEGVPGSGRRHMARAYANHLGHRMSSCVVLDLKLVPSGQMRACLADLATQMSPGVLVVANAECLEPDAASWLICHGQTEEVPGHLVLTMDTAARGAIPDAIRRAFASSRVEVPTLSERLEDLDLIVNSILRRLGARPEQLAPTARVLLARRSWTGEVSELRETLARAVARARGESIVPEYLSEDDLTPGTGTCLSESLDRGYQGAVRVFRRDLLRYALETTGGNRTHAAELLGVQRTYFMRLIRELGADDIRPVG
ncbi:MAG: helix-turn-helix domain-containing protein, partial [Myxococcota bacterium]|nr:helix-turn-helix domain-containing protein [Myxococcota bacterium]